MKQNGFAKYQALLVVFLFLVSAKTYGQNTVDSINVSVDSSGVSQSISIPENLNAVPPPSNFKATIVSSTKINLSWDAVPGAIEYQLKGIYGSLLYTGLNKSYLDTGLTCGTGISYSVTVKTAEGTSVPAAINQTPPCPPSRPTGFTATPVSSTQINLKWDLVPGVTYTLIGYYGQTLCSGYTSPTYSDTGLTCGSLISYTLIAYNAGGPSPSASLSVSTLTCPPPKYTLTVIAANGTVVINPDQASYLNGTTVQLTATPAAGYTFVGWSGDVTGTTDPLTITMNGNKYITANFRQTQCTLTVTAANGTVTKIPDQTIYNYGTNVVLTATPASGYIFSNWSGSASGTTNPLIVTMDGNKNITANFRQTQFTLIVTAANGTVTKIPDQMTYNNGTNVVLTATPATGYSFTGWSGSASGTTNPLIVTMDGNKNITANFAQMQYTLTVTAANGTVTKIPDQMTYNNGTNVQLTATPATGYIFAGWSGDASGTTNPLTVAMNGNKNITANFAQTQCTLTVTAANGTVTKIPDQTSYISGTTVQLTATPATGYSFTGWSGDASGTANPLTVAMNGNKNITANFAQMQYTLTVNAANGTVTKVPDQASYISGTTVQLTATPATGYSFTGWSGDASGTANPLTVAMNGNKNITANFAQMQYTLTVNATNGTVTKIPDQASYISGTTVQLTAAPAVGYTFTGWSGDASGTTNSLTVTMNGNKNITANFAQMQYTLTVNAANGTVTRVPDQTTYSYGITVQLTATPAGGYTFSNWSGDASGTTNPLTITINGNKNITAIFTVIPPTISLSTTNLSAHYYDRTASFTISNSGGGTLNWNVSPDANWITVNPASGTNSGTVIVNYDFNIGITTRIGSITVSASGATNTPQTVTVTQDGATPYTNMTPKIFWRGVYFYGMKEASNKSLFFNTLKDNLNLNVYQVRTLDGVPDRDKFFLQNDVDELNVITQMDTLAILSSFTNVGDLKAHKYDLSIQKEVNTILSYAGSKHFRFYLRDEPEANMFSAWNYVKNSILNYDSQALQPTYNKGSVAAYADTGSNIEQFLLNAQPSELIIDPYFLYKSIPHPSLDANICASNLAGIEPWNYGCYLGLLQQYLNQALNEKIRPAAEAAKYSAFPVPFILAPQLHGMMFKFKQKCDHDNNYEDSRCLRTPSSSEIKLQFYIGIAYGAKGFLAYPYSTDIVWDSTYSDSLAFPGLVSIDPTLTNHDSNYGTIFGKYIYTGYKEKWTALSEVYGSLKANQLEETLLALSWVGAKSWTMTQGWDKEAIPTLHWDDIVTNCTATVNKPPDLCDPCAPWNDRPQVEVGHLQSSNLTDYIVVVNRRCAKSDVAHISITLKTLQSGRWRVTDIERPTFHDTVDGRGSFTDTFEPGCGKIYRLEKVVLAKQSQLTKEEELPKEYIVYQNYPNPFNPTSTIKYQLPKDGLITLKVYDILGREVAELVNEMKQAGYYQVDFNASKLAGGIYIYRISANGFVQVKKMLLLK